MTFTRLPSSNSYHRQHLVNLGSGVPVTASEVKVYHMRKDGTKGRLLRTEPATTYTEFLRHKKKAKP